MRHYAQTCLSCCHSQLHMRVLCSQMFHSHNMSKTLTYNDFPPLSSLRLIVPPLQLLSAALLEIVKQGVVMSSCGVMEEFITTVLETAPELLTDTERAQLVIGLRAKVVLELCRSDAFADQQALQHHLSEMNSYITKLDNEASNSEVKTSVVNFLNFIHTLNKDQSQKEAFYQNIFLTMFGPKYDSALQALMKKFLFNLQELLPVPSFEQTSLWLTLSPTILKDCLDFMNQPQPLKTLIQHHKHHGHKVPAVFTSSGDDCILSSLSIHLPNVENTKGCAQVKSEPMCDSQDWKRDDFLQREDTEDDFKLLDPELVRNVEEPGQQCVDEVTEDQGAYAEVILSSFDENESSDNDHIVKKMSHHLKRGRRTSAKTSQCENDEDLSCGSKRKKNKITQSAVIAEPKIQSGSTSQSSSFKDVKVQNSNSAKTMYRSKELSEDLRLRIVDLHKAGEGYKKISQNLDVPRSTVRKIICKWKKFNTVATLPRSGRPVKMTARAQSRMLSELKKNPGVSTKDLHKSLAHANISVTESTIRRTLKKNRVHGWTTQSTTPLSSLEK